MPCGMSHELRVGHVKTLLKAHVGRNQFCGFLLGFLSFSRSCLRVGHATQPQFRARFNG